MNEAKTPPAKRGRPATRPKNLTPKGIAKSQLCALLEKRLTRFVVRNRLSVAQLAAAMDVTRSALYYYLSHDYLTEDGAARLLSASDNKLAPEDLTRFITAA